MDSTYEIREENGALNVVIKGKFDVILAKKIQTDLEQLIQKEFGNAKFDLSNTTFMASSGLRVMIFVKKNMKIASGITVIGAKTNVKAIFTMSGTDKYFTFQD